MTAAGIKELRSIRLRRETVNGTAVTPRFLWRGNGEMVDDQREVIMVEEQVGIYGGTDRSYIPKLMAEIPLAETEATFEQLGDILLMLGLGTLAAGFQGSAQGANGSAVQQLLGIPVDTLPQAISYTLEAGDNTAAMQCTYCVASEVTLNFNGGEALKVEATLMARDGTPANAVGSYSAVGTLPAVETILASRGTAWLTPQGSGFGTGQVTAGNILAGNITFTTKWAMKYPVDTGQLFFHTAVFTGMDIEGELTLEHQVSGTYGAAGSAGQREKWRAQDAQLLRLRWSGGTISDGTTFSNKSLQIDLPMKWQKFEPLDDQDGNGIAVGKFVSKYNEFTPAAGRGTIQIVRRGTSEMAGA